jgi:signal transduction histidine kinase
MRVWIGKMREYTSYMSDIITTVKGQAVQMTSAMTEYFTIKELIKRVDILMNHELKRYCCNLNVQCSIGMDTEVSGDINGLIQVINNLITNGIDSYEGSAGTIDFEISRQGTMMQFIVRDYGTGIRDEVKSKLFKEMITTKAKNGTGLGLYMSYSMITGRFGGKMWFESEYGKGTTFYIQIPAAR